MPQSNGGLAGTASPWVNRVMPKRSFSGSTMLCAKYSADGAELGTPCNDGGHSQGLEIFDVTKTAWCVGGDSQRLSAEYSCPMPETVSFDSDLAYDDVLERFATYITLSAAARSSSALRPSRGYNAAPMLAPVITSSPSTSNGTANASSSADTRT